MDASTNAGRSTRAATAMASTMRPVTFNGRFGWLHEPIGRSAGVGVVLAPPLGRDARCAHVPTRLLADKLAAAGFPALRYDPLGAGDSLDLPDETADAVPAWIGGVDLAADALRAMSGVERIVLGGLRLGATFAAVSLANADGLLLLAPVMSGRSWLRRLRFAARMSKSGAPALGDGQPLDTDGLWLSAATAASLAHIDLARSTAPQKPVFVAAQNQLVKTYAEGLAKAGASVRVSDFPGFNDLFLEPAVNLAPYEVFDAACAWLAETFGASEASMAPASSLKAKTLVLRPPGCAERHVVFGAGLRGVLCEPEGAAANAPTVIFCNAGGDPRAGSGGFATQAARRLATRGVFSLRFDFAGLGDSDAPTGEDRCHVFETPREADMDAAVAFLEAQGHKEFVTVGVCSGAYHALRAAWRLDPIKGVFAISPLKMIWRAGDSVSFARDEYLLSMSVYTKALFDPSAWKLAMEKKISAFTFLLALANRLRNRVFGWLSQRGEVSPLAETRRFLHRGGRAALVMGVNDSSLEEVETYFGPKGAKLRRFKGASIDIIPDLDHGLSRRISREIATSQLIEWLMPESDV